jgi:sugar phosphate isomerase/epimerase
MLIGLKLDIGFAQDEVYRQLYGGREILTFLREQEVEVVETPLGPETDPAMMREHVSRCVSAGLKLTMHPYSESSVYNPAFFSANGQNPCRALHERFFSLAAEAARLQRYPTVVNLHGAAGTAAEPRERLKDQSISFFRWAGDWCRRHAPEVAVAAELQISPDADEPRQRIGDHYEELLEVAVQSGVMACWDFGHAWWNTKRFGWPLYPPAELVKRIGHVHCHDVHGDDHQPLLYGVVPWRDFLNVLTAAGFDGRIILEVPPSEFLRAGGLGTLTTSLEALRAWMQQRASDAVPR